VTPEAGAGSPERSAGSGPCPRKSWRSTILWGLVLAVVALGGTWAVTNWKVLHLAYCQRLMASKSEKRQIDGVQKVGLTHLRAGMTLEQVARLFAPARLDGPLEGTPGEVRASDKATGLYLAHPMSTDDGVALQFDAGGKLVKWWVWP